jgi:hypothetical protein
MSKSNNINITCPYCGYQFEAWMGKYADYACSQCHQSIPKEKNFLQKIPDVLMSWYKKCFFFVPAEHKESAMIIFGVVFLTFLALIPTIRKNCRERSISDQVFAMLKGEKYCARCRSSHEIGVVSEQVWTKGTLDQGWVAYVSLLPKGRCNPNLIREYSLILRNGLLVNMKFEELIDPDYDPSDNINYDDLGQHPR